MPTPYPAGSPTVNGRTVTVDAFLRSPARVQRTIDQLANNRFIADLIFRQGPPAVGGAVIYDQVLAAESSFTERDVQEIEPGSEFPIVNSGELSPNVATAKKYGGEVMLTDEAVRRDARDLLGRETVKLRNTIVRKVDTVAIAALEAAPILSFAGADWGTAATDILAQLAQAAYLSTSLDMGYNPDTVLINPAQELDLLVDTDIRNALSADNGGTLIRTGQVGTLLGFTFIRTSRVPAGTAYLVERGAVGSISDEVPLYARPLHDDRRETWFIHGARVAVPYVTDPKAAVKLTGI